MAAMLPWNNDNSHATIHSILELYQRCRRNGDWARIYLETQDGREFFSISISPSAGTSAGVEKVNRARKKNPSQVRRDQKRRAVFLERRHKKAEATPKTTSTPTLESTVSRTDKFRIEEEKTVTGETGSTEEVKTTESETSDNTMNNVVIREEVVEEEEGRMTQEDIEQLRKIIKDAVDNGNRMYKEHVVNYCNTKEKVNQIKDEDCSDENDNIEEAKLWAVGQKQSFIKNEINN